jgi:hypothetical protein
MEEMEFFFLSLNDYLVNQAREVSLGGCLELPCAAGYGIDKRPAAGGF